MAIQTSNLGYPRIGLQREWKKTLEAFWSNKIDEEQFLTTMKEIRLQHVKVQQEKGIELIPIGDFTYYDHVLDTAYMLGFIPSRFSEFTSYLDVYFAMARGSKDHVASEMTKWFNTNYHYIVPEYEEGLQISLKDNRPLRLYEEAKQELGVDGKPVILGPYTFLKLAKGYTQEQFTTILKQLVAPYVQLLSELHAAGAQVIQVDEPIFASLTKEEVQQAKEIYEAIRKEVPNANLLLQTYFDSVEENYEEIITFPVSGIGLDFVHGKEGNLHAISQYGFPADKTLAVGCIDGRNIWRADLDEVLTLFTTLQKQVQTKDFIVQPSCSLLHTPIDKTEETHLSTELFDALAFANQKLEELVLIHSALTKGTESISNELETYRNVHHTIRSSAVRNREDVKAARTALKEEDFSRPLPFEKRYELQQVALELPLLPTTTIGSFPQTTEVRQTRKEWRNGVISNEQYEQFIEKETEKWIRYQEEIGLDVLVHGEFERTDMVEYFGERLAGFSFTKNGWVQSYGSRCVKPPVIYGDVAFINGMTIKETVYAQSLTEKVVKGMLTGPVTILNWSFVRNDIPRKEVSYQIALALRHEIELLESSGIRVIQVDEPALREGMPLKEKDWDAYITWAVQSFLLATSSVANETQIHTHMCYSNFEDIVDAIRALDADVISIETSRSHGEFIDTLKHTTYEKGIGLGVYDIHSPRVPSKDEMYKIVEQSLEVCDPKYFWINPDCGLKTRRTEEVIPALEHMVQAAKDARSLLKTNA
ncbi:MULTISPECIES: 5-methyltetrahydropteroyltriglutamate--homocysteine S-methyltransferase [unclassified Bacillus (in: firmicutes)]|uniref:5-methyltetrahydropteroyltriglutamate-- homocysteine S-methyltransferase n=1 Tax=unclassified Bacillus (in: firmicutes) TaxID=185979 RepID=UPI00032DB49F|nr:5-methyltetrahydropteroyltriglutamate-homocysteine methyltransferase [Bacillus cereus BAG2O-3]EOQ09698.1 5-methyltetrahydropteroyltriglutamate-homocysteine methyltransferase [Bacillus cereus B5-2]PEW33643.1 5-methyltetrahydropteroyltriglutamate--homocysteine methyltransferase [Bacillus cereus]PFW85316.1 5-methyltetrahydropteroyltriglutamate--homocysteine methyltransferase [Bacillus sp. AFS075960]RFB50047.1 5-methyltetrahydropteroyltriglutamate--homocysteine methyltransferase [Bacillus sp. dm